MPSASRLSSPVRPCGIAVSRTSRSRNGEATETSEDSADQQADDGEPAAVGAEESEDAAHAGGVAPWVGVAGGVH